MAIVKYGLIVTELIGKFGGSVFQRCGQSLSLRKSATYPTSVANSVLHSRFDFGILASTWREMSLSDRETFNTHAASYPAYDKFGNVIVLTGYQLYIYLNRKLLLCGVSLVTSCTAYAPPSACGIDFGDINLTSGVFNVRVLGTLPASHYVMFYISDQINSIVPNLACKKWFSFAATGLTSSYTDYLTTLLASFKNSAIIGKSVYIDVYLVNALTGNFYFEVSQRKEIV